MFSGLTNQVSSWMNKKPQQQQSVDKTEGNDNKEEGAPSEPAGENKSTSSRHLEMLGNVKHQMSSWIGSGIAGLRKASESGGGTDTVGDDGKEPKIIPEDSSTASKDEDNSSTTGGADSEGVVSDIEDGDTKESAASAVSTKAIEGAKNLGNFLYSAVNRAGKTVTEASAKIKKTVEENSILGELNKEQEAFIKEKETMKKNGEALPPWVGCPNEKAVKEECLALSLDRKNFVRSPPAGIDFTFDYNISYPVAMATLAEDPNLEKMRFELVPKVVNEETFWKNYFYRVSLICQENELSCMDEEHRQATASTSYATSASKFEEKDFEKELDTELQDFEFVSESNHSAVGAKSGYLDDLEEDLANLK